ncbi:MAG: bacterial Ig-like domain-containing protein, partial [Bacteroidaceae bacterium]|nr:bacterial Ig-like domain-containing protein [Bacteroidaceae bacterium]
DDYDVSYANNTAVGEATVTVALKGNYSGTLTASFAIEPKPADDDFAVAEIAAQTYTGSELTPDVTVTDGENTLTSDDYDVAYEDNTSVGTATVTVTLKGNYSGTLTASFTIEPKPADDDFAVAEIAAQTYTGSELTPDVTVTDGENTLTSDDYDVSYADNTAVGEATVTVTLKGNYSGTLTASFTIGYYNASLIDDGDDNETVISTIVSEYGGKANVTLSGRTFFKDGHWNTICLPFDVTIADSPLAGADVRELNSAAFSNGTLTLEFTEVTEIKAGVPYIVKWTETGDPIVEAVFEGVTLSNSAPSEIVVDLGDEKSVTFKGIYAPIAYTATDKSALLVGEGSTLYYPLEGAYVNAQHAYFQLTGIEVGDVESNAIGLHFGDATGIYDLKNLNVLDANYYDLSGRRLEGQPTETGIYIVNGKKVVVK